MDFAAAAGADMAAGIGDFGPFDRILIPKAFWNDRANLHGADFFTPSECRLNCSGQFLMTADIGMNAVEEIIRV